MPSTTAARPDVISLRETTLPRLLWCLARGRVPYILGVHGIIPGMTGRLKAWVKRLVAQGRCRWATDLAPELEQHRVFDRRAFFDEFPLKSEPWQAERYGFSPADLTDIPYGRAFRHMASCHAFFDHVVEVYCLAAFAGLPEEGSFRYSGLRGDVLDLMKSTLGREASPNMTAASADSLIGRVLGGFGRIVFRAAWLSGCLLLLVLTALRLVRRKGGTLRPFVVFDSLKDAREYHLLDEIKDGGEIVLLDRFPGFPWPGRPEGGSYSEISWTAGWLAPGEAPGLLLGGLRDTLALFRHHSAVPDSLFATLLLLPRKRLRIRAFLNAVQPTGGFIGRDEYNEDHIIRYAECRRLGIPSLGLSGGMFPAYCSAASNIRYNTFDLYYAFSARFFESYAETWLAEMTVRSAASLALSRQAQLGTDKPRPEAVLIALRVAWNQAEAPLLVAKIAAAFPDRPVRLQFKQGFVSEGAREDFLGSLLQEHPNLSLVDGSVYDLVDDAGYVISDTSTLVAEAIRMGARTVFADFLDQEFCIYRSFPGLGVKTADGAVLRLAALIDGTEPWPLEDYLALMDCPADSVNFDLLRKDLGLKPKLPA
ncbi:MAG: hypothetical protein ACPGOV_01810 [Magnetovibrionaceae bacterium]